MVTRLEASPVKRQGEKAATCFPLVDRYIPQKQVMVSHHGSQFSAARNFFKERGITPDQEQALNTLLNRRGEWRFKGNKEIDPYSLPMDEFDSFLSEVFAPVYALIDPSVNKVSPAYNTHGKVHADRVTYRSRMLLQMAGCDEKSTRIGIAEARGHDLGIVFSREAHPIISPRMFELMIPQIKLDRESWQKIKLGIFYHETSTARLAKARFGRVPPSERIRRMGEFLGPGWLALVIADKTDVGRHRLSEHTNPRFIKEDPHVKINLLGRTEHVGLSADGKTVQWFLEFTPGGVFNNDYRAYGKPVPEKKRLAQHDNKHGNILRPAPFYQWVNLFWKTYLERNIFAIEAGLALFPSATSFEVIMREGETGEMKYTFRRDHVAGDIRVVREDYSLPRKKG